MPKNKAAHAEVALALAPPAPKPAAGTSTEFDAVPVAACRLSRVALQFADSEPPDDSGRPAAVPFNILARTGAAIFHWYWGKIVHDMAGFTASKPKISIDYVHDDDEILGFADKQTAADEGLRLAGKLTPFKPDDRASEIIFKAAAGVPYEASISFDYSSLEYLTEGAAATVNGQTVTGPAYIVRQWTIDGTAICPHGADPATETSFKRGERPEIARTVTLFSKPGVSAMHIDNTPAPNTPPADATNLSTSTPTDPATSEAAVVARLNKFTTKFGSENGVKWFTAGKTYEEALELHADALASDLAKSREETAAANTKLANAPRGEGTALSQSDAEKGTNKNPQQLSGANPRLANFAAKCKIPT